MPEGKNYVTDAEIYEAVNAAHHLEVSLLMIRVERLTALLRENGIQVPDGRDDPRLGAGDGRHLEACRQVVIKAYELLERLEELRGIVGSGMELVAGERWKP